MSTRVGLIMTLLVTTLAGGAACSKTSVPTGPPDASAGTTVKPPYAGPLEAHLVARAVSWNTRLRELTNGKVLFDAGLFLYELTPDGIALRVGDVASYQAFVPEGDDDLAGYDIKPLPSRTVFRVAPSNAITISTDTNTWTRTGAAWTKGAVEAVSDAGSDAGGGAALVRDPFDTREVDLTRGLPGALIDGRGHLDVPAGIEDTNLRRANDGTSIAIAREVDGGPPITLIAPRGSRAAKLVRITDFGVGAPAKGMNCEHVVSWSTPHLLCRTYDAEPWFSLHRLKGDGWELIPLDPAIAKDATTVTAVGADGTLWIALRGPRLTRITSAGLTETFALPSTQPSVVPATYWSEMSLARPPTREPDRGDDFFGARRWDRLSIHTAPTHDTFDKVRSIVPLATGEAWVLVTETAYGVGLFHLSRPAIAPLPAPVIIGTEVDQRNEIRNSRPPKRWVGHCPLIFVALEKQRAGGSLYTQTLWEREKTIGAVVKKAFGTTTRGLPSAALVEGRLGGRRVAGVLVWRRDATASEALLEKAANAVASEITPGMQPDVTCTAPVLERAALL